MAFAHSRVGSDLTAVVLARSWPGTGTRLYSGACINFPVRMIKTVNFEVTTVTVMLASVTARIAVLASF